MKHISSYIHQQLQTRFPPEEIRCFERLILTAICGMTYERQICCKDTQIPQNKKKRIYTIIERLKKMEPLQYILGETVFYSIPLKVNPSVLIPRPETEELVDTIIKSDFVKSFHPAADNRTFSQLHDTSAPIRILDIGTGSGCIAIALSRHIPNAYVTAIDISLKAIHTAQKNAQLNQTPIKFIQTDILNTQKSAQQLPEYFDLIVSNPPYIKAEEKPSLSANVINYEPHIALFAPADDPLLYYKAIADYAQQKLAPTGMLYLEINPLCDLSITDMLYKKGFTHTTLTRDLSGKNRFIASKTLHLNP